jgi:hypothetical protein
MELVRHRYLKREWPADLAALVPVLTQDDLAELAKTREGLDTKGVLARFPHAKKPKSASFFELVVDWYLLRNGRALALPHIGDGRMAAYEKLARLFAAGLWEAGSVQARLAAFFRMFSVYASGQPSENFSIDLATGEVTPAGHFGRTERRQTGSA